MSDRFVSRKGRESEVFPKSTGQNATDEGQVSLPFAWHNSSDKKKNVVSVKDGYAMDFMASPTTIDYDVTLGDEKNYMTVGPITIADGVTVTLEDGSSWSIV